jgi:hypothetical protein
MNIDPSSSNHHPLPSDNLSIYPNHHPRRDTVHYVRVTTLPDGDDAVGGDADVGL